jgi:hypothetical protein
MAPNLWGANAKISSDIIETFLNEQILSLEELPDGLRGEMLLRQRTDRYLPDRPRHLQPLRDGWVDEPAQFLSSILPGLLAKDEPGALHEAVQCLWTAWKRSHAGEAPPRRPDLAFLSAVGADRMGTALVTKFQDAAPRHRDDLLLVLELFAGALAGQLLPVIEHRDIWVRRNACRMLAGLGTTVIPELLQATDARWESWYFVRNAVMILGDIGSCDEAVLALLRRCQRHPHLRVQEETLTSYGKLKSPEAERYLLEALDDKDLALCARAILALGTRQTMHERALRFLRDTLQRKPKDDAEADDRLQIDACLALDTIISAHPEVADTFGPLLREALAQEKRLLSGLTGQKFREKSPAVRQAIQKVLARIDRAAAGQVSRS